MQKRRFTIPKVRAHSDIPNLELDFEHVTWHVQKTLSSWPVFSCLYYTERIIWCFAEAL